LNISESRYNLFKSPILPKWQITNDLHLHTSMSDGNITPKDLIEKISLTNINCIAITDHDTTKGVEESLKFAYKKNITTIPGVEISTSFQGNEIHVIGYFINIKNHYLQTKLKNLRLSRKRSILKTINRLQLLGYKISMEEIKNISNGTIGRPHIAQIMKSKGYFNTTTEAFEKILSNKKIININREKINSIDAIELITQSGGISVLAHPRSIKNLEKILPMFVNKGLTGIEIYSEKLTQKTLEFLKKLSEKYNLIPTGGSDYHARNEPNEIQPGMNGPPPHTPEKLFTKAFEIHGANIGIIPKGF